MRNMEWVWEQLTSLVNDIPMCYANRVEDGYTLCCSSGVMWQKRVKKQWGHAHDRGSYIRIHIDAPRGQFSKSALASHLGLSEKSYDGQVGSVHVFGNDSDAYDRLEIAIGESDLNWFNMTKGRFPDLVRLVASLSCIGVADKMGLVSFQSRMKNTLYGTFPGDATVIDELLEQEFEGKYAVPDHVGERKLRIGHRVFAERVKGNYGFRCALTGVSTPEFLVASHIVPWSKDHTIRLDPSNGICLSVLVDKAFDQGFLIFDEDYRVCLSPRVQTDPILEELLSPYGGKTLNLPLICSPRPEYLQRHRDIHSKVPFNSGSTSSSAL